MQSIEPRELKRRLDAGEHFLLLDVREQDEFALANIGGTLIPLGELPHRHHELPRDRTIACLCHHGVRSARAAQFLVSAGFEKVVNIQGGIDRWSCDVDARVARY